MGLVASLLDFWFDRGAETLIDAVASAIEQGPLTDDRLDALYKAGCDDATFSTRNKPDLRRLESVPGGEVLHVDPDELVWASEIAERTGSSRQSIDMLIKGQRGPRQFPGASVARPSRPATGCTAHPISPTSEKLSANSRCASALGRRISPALLTRMSTPLVVAMARSTASGSVTSNASEARARPEPGGRLAGALGEEIVYEDARSSIDEHTRDSEADAPPGASHHGASSSQIEHVPNIIRLVAEICDAACRA